MCSISWEEMRGPTPTIPPPPLEIEIEARKRCPCGELFAPRLEIGRIKRATGGALCGLPSECGGDQARDITSDLPSNLHAGQHYR